MLYDGSLLESVISEKGSVIGNTNPTDPLSEITDSIYVKEPSSFKNKSHPSSLFCS